ncbi:arsenic resistance protein [Paenibacillus sp. BGI2013]|uniref:arsenic resistance protein n=1 Tax=Paenibacillus TaxID=44249 RepID=UPI00096C16A7|nr:MULTISPECIES: bile acid:sodium symporter [Paenibacillus]OMF38582.1 arsenic resistance protein [Paenibacillus amylolyticus]PKQ87524.1 arsenic resistance protein [Paenibacillus sp. BGI2013]
MLTRETMEQQQTWFYVVALFVGAAIGLSNPAWGNVLHYTVSPVLAVLLYSMFVQIPFLQLKESWSNLRFMGALLVANFIVVPVVVWLLTLVFPQSPGVLIGVYLVLLTPCIDYVIVFTQLGRGNEKLMLAATPLLFVIQMILLPFYLWLLMGTEVAQIMQVGPFVEAFLFLIVIPLLLAVVTQVFSRGKASGERVINATAWLPVPMMALALIVVVASQIGKVYNDMAIIVNVIPIYIAFLIIMPWISRIIANGFRLNPGAGRALIFSSATRNSLVVLPLALALPPEWATIAAAVIVTQTMVELAGELIYIRLVPAVILRDR